MVKKKTEGPERNWLQQLHEEHEQRKRDNPVVKTKWYVIEITPAHRYATGDGHGGTDWEWESENREVVSPEFNDKVSAQAWMDKHEPDEGKTLEISYQNLRRFTEHRWVNW